MAAVMGGGECGTCGPKPAGPLVKRLVAGGFADVRMFPLGPAGGWLVCFSHGTGQLGTVFSCLWGDPKTLGEADYVNGSASGLADAAAKTRRILATVER